MVTIEMLNETLKKVKLANCPSGTMCTFVRVSEGWGVKLFREERFAKQSYHCQKYLATLGVCPHVGDYIGEFKYARPVLKLVDGVHKTINEEQKYYGFVTEAVKVCDGPQLLYHKFIRQAEKYTALADERVRVEVSRCLGLDNHNGNWGIKDGEYVKIDVDCASEELYKKLIKFGLTK